MSLEQVYYVSQVVAAAAIIGSLIYLAVQTQQTSKNQRAMMHWNRMESARDATRRIADPTFAPIWRAGMAADPQMDSTACHAFAWFERGTLISYQEQFLEHRDGMIDDRRWKATWNGLNSRLDFPGFRAVYKLARVNLNPEFVAMVDALLVEAGKTPPPDWGTAWQKLAAEELAAVSAGS